MKCASRCTSVPFLRGPGRAQNASITAGMPTENSVTIEPLRSASGNSPITSAETISSAIDRMRVRNRRRMSCMPLTMRCPSLTAGASAANESFIRMMSATARVACVPLSMAMPRFDFFSESTSFTPSPIIAT